MKHSFHWLVVTQGDASVVGTTVSCGQPVGTAVIGAVVGDSVGPVLGVLEGPVVGSNEGEVDGN